MIAALILSTLLWVADTVYRAAADISYIDRQKCVVFRFLPRPGFLIYEYLFETIAIVLVGTFIAVLLAHNFSRLKKYFPKNPVTAFCYGSLIPVCSCAAIPLLSSMKGRLGFSTAMAFVIAAPLLSPHIIVLSFSVLGLKYGVLRILSSFVLVMITALVMGSVNRKRGADEARGMIASCDRDCGPADGDVYLKTFAVFKRLLPFLMIGGAMGVLLEFFGTRDLLMHRVLGDGVAGALFWTLAGVPIYFCHGAEVLFLRPLMNHGFPMGTGIAFSMTSTAVCTTSIAMLFRLIGKRLAAVLIGCIVSISLGLALLINSL